MSSSGQGEAEPLLAELVDDVGDLHFDSYWDIVRYNFDLFDVTLWLEFLRQWIVIICTIVMSILFVVSVLRLRKTQNGCDIDQIILIAELVKVRSYLAHIFQYSLLISTIVCFV